MSDHAPPWNPSPPTDTRRPKQAEVTPEMTAWSVEVLHDRAYPMHAVTRRMFGEQFVIARVEWHTNPTTENPTEHPHRGITLYFADAPDAPPEVA